jgi:hypothetical protein
VKRRREVSKYQRYADMDRELHKDGPLRAYLTSLAAYPGDSDEFISTHQYTSDSASETEEEARPVTDS